MTYRFSAEVGGKKRAIAVERLEGDGGGRYRVTIDGRTQEYEARTTERGERATTWVLTHSGGGANLVVDVDGVGSDLTLSGAGHSFAIKLIDAKAEVAARAPSAQSAGPQGVVSLMPGKVVKVLVKVGDAVKTGQGLVVVEAMKMENELKAMRDGTVSKINVQEGAAVEAGQSLLTLG